ncbi:MAG: UvrD-helicase domain-containing protein, partial [Rickettsiales bacterium]|nr:UvrD-helicase domain-containing protein [Rickettsiales bacterium]
MVDDNSLMNQKLAADPDSSVWVSASAGAGKTTVLVSRLLRLFLDGVEPHRVLCLTYTNAGALEMQGRIFARARSWSVACDAALTGELESLFGGDADEEELRALLRPARALFSRLIDSPMPLRIYTIHAFCQSVLKRFPIEAGVSPHFKVVEEIEAGILLKESYRSLVARIRDGEGEDGARLLADFGYMTSNVSEFEFEDIRESMISVREKFSALLEKYGTLPRLADELRRGIFSSFPDALDDFIGDSNLHIRNVISHVPADLIRSFASALESAKSASAKENSAALYAFLSLDGEDEKLARFDGYRHVFLTLGGSARKNFIPADIRKKFPDLADGLDAEAERLRAADEFARCSEVYRMTVAVADVGIALMEEYRRLKDTRGVMDFSDLVESVERLLRRPNVSEWILYKMDGGISHVLIDEAQDTSGAQWSIVEMLTEQFFTTGRGLGDMKSVFSVGDRKQSIFSFQGADISLFDKYRALFKKRVEDGGFVFRELPLSRSFRSARNVLRVVDAVIADGSKARGIVAEGGHVPHVPHRADTDGYVELMPLAKSYREDDSYFKPPVEVVEVKNPKIDLSDMVAEKIRRMIGGDSIRDGGVLRRVRPSDIMVLVQKRSSAKYLLGRLAARGVPTSGEDRLRLEDSIVVQDLMSLLKFAVSSADDLSLCEALKSPLFNLGDDDLFELCHGRSGSVFDSMSRNPKYAELYKSLSSLVELGRIETPFLFFDRVLKAMGGRMNFIARFGRAVDDILNEFIGKCLLYDRARMGKSLVDFLRWFEASDMEARRDMEAAGGVVRVMTVHGAKGLEAPIVFLFDANLSDAPLRDRILWHDGLPLYKAAEFGTINAEFGRIYDERKAAGLEEFYRLLYVAMTRARDRLYVSGWESRGDGNGKSWYACIKGAMGKFPDARSVRDDILAAKGAEFFEPEVLALGEKDTGECGEVPQTERP